MNIRAVIVDDEELARRGIAARLCKFDDIEIVAECKNGREAIAAIKKFTPDLVFLDIQMPGKTGFDVIREIETPSFPLIIFVTAHDEHAIRAFQVNALDYVLKPIDDERFEGVVRRIRAAVLQRNQSALGQMLQSVFEKMGHPSDGRHPQKDADEIVVKSAGRMRFIKTADIDWIQASGDYVKIYQGERSWLMHATISSMEKKLKARGFLRIHRSAIVNPARISELIAMDNGEYEVVLHGGTKLKLSRNYRAAMTELLSGRSL